MAKFAQGDLIKARAAIEYTPRSRKGAIRSGTQGVVIKSLTGGQVMSYFHGHGVIIVGDPSLIRHR